MKSATKKQITIINHSNISPKRHLNRSKLHFNNFGRSVFVKNIRNFLNDSNNRTQVTSTVHLPQKSDDNLRFSDANEFRNIREQYFKNPKTLIIR